MNRCITTFQRLKIETLSIRNCRLSNSKITQVIFSTLLNIVVALLLASCGNKDYQVETHGHVIDITIPQRTVGIAGVNQVDYGGVSLYDVAEDVYSEFHGIKGLFKDGTYTVYLFTTGTNEYGETETSSSKGELCKLETAEMKRYTNSGYFTRGFAEKIEQMCGTLEYEPQSYSDNNFIDYETSRDALEEFDRQQKEAAQREQAGQKTLMDVFLGISWVWYVVAGVLAVFLLMVFQPLRRWILSAVVFIAVLIGAGKYIEMDFSNWTIGEVLGFAFVVAFSLGSAWLVYGWFDKEK